MNVTLSCTGLQETVAKGATIAEPTLTCSDGSEPSSKQWTGRPGGTTNPSWTVSQNTNTTSYNIKVTATCGTASNLAADCGTVTVGTPGSSSSVAGGSSSSRGGSSSSVTTGGTSSAGGGNKTCTLSKRSLTNERYASQTSNNDRVLDLTVPSGNGPFPLIIFVHGGGFTSGNKSSLSSPFSATNATNRGYAFASINHRLASNSQRGFPEGIEDILTAIRFLRAKADSLCLDPNRFAMTGFSAGGYHTGMVAVLSGATHDFDNSALGYPGVSSAVQVAVSQSALTDFTKLDAQQQELGGRWTMSTHYGSGSMLSQYLGITTTASNIPAKSNPLTYVSANTIPIMMQHGLSDNLVPWKQSELLVNEINKKASGRAILDTLKDQGHGNFSNSDLTSTVYNFLDRHLK
jgi:acetyl esterase/lipase